MIILYSLFLTKDETIKGGSDITNIFIILFIIVIVALTYFFMYIYSFFFFSFPNDNKCFDLDFCFLCFVWIHCCLEISK